MRKSLVAFALAIALVAACLLDVQAQGPFSAQIQAALRAFIAQAHVWTGTQSFTNIVATDIETTDLEITGTCIGCGGGGGQWTTTVVKTMDQTVTNSTTLVSDTELTLPVSSGEVWTFEAVVLYQDNQASRDILMNFVFPTASGLHYIEQPWNSADNVTQESFIQEINRTNWAGNITSGGSNTDDLRWVKFYFTYRFDASGNVTLQFANALAEASHTSTVKAGSVFRAEQFVAP